MGFPCSHLLTLNLCLMGEVFDAVDSEIEAGRNLSSLLLLGCVALRRVSNVHCRGNSVNTSLSLLSRFVRQFVRECRDDSCLCSLVFSSPSSFKNLLFFLVVTRFMVIFACFVLQPRNRSKRNRSSTRTCCTQSANMVCRCASRLGVHRQTRRHQQ